MINIETLNAAKRYQKIFKEQKNRSLKIIKKQIRGGHASSINLGIFFAQGEIGPVSGKNFVHGLTASLLIFD